MKIEDFDATIEANTEKDIEAALSRRFANGVNSFWLHRDMHSKLPALSILVNGDLASLTYFPNKPHPGFRSVGRSEQAESAGTTIFFMDSPRQKVEILNDSIVPFSDALQAAKEFLHSEKLPHSIKWFEL